MKFYDTRSRMYKIMKFWVKITRIFRKTEREVIGQAENGAYGVFEFPLEVGEKFSQIKFKTT